LDGTIDKHAVPFVADRTWIKLTLASGWVKLWVSVDGRHFARAGAPTSVEQAVSGIGLYALAHPSARTICLAELVLHELDVLNQLAPVGLRERADGLATQQNIASFQEAADKLRPSGVDRLEWMRACAVGQLAMGVNAELGGAFIEWLWQESAWMKLPFDQRLRLIEQLSTMTPSWKNVDLAQRQLRHYEELGRELATLERASPYSRIAVPQMLAPLWSQSRFDFFPAGVARHEALDLALGRQWEDLQLLVTRLDFYHFPEASDAGNFYRWLASLSDRQQPAAVGLSRGGSSAEWRHPFTTELSKEGFNVLADLQVALESNAYRDACQVIGSANSSGMLGLLPDSKDPDLSVSLPATVALAMREHPRFRDTMAEQFGPLGRLRVRQAIASGNANAVEAATLQFYGTEAAAEAHLWLADRAISSGAFAAAQGHYRAARKTAPKELMTRLAASEQLAAALMGEDAGLKPFGTVQLGEVQVQANEIAGLSDQLRAARVAESAIADAPFPDPEVVRLPAPSDFDAIQRARFEGEAGRAPHDVPNEYRQRGPDWPANSVDWVAEQMHVQPLKDRVLIGNRFQLASYDPESGAMQWRAGLGGDMASAHDWPLSPMRTLATSKVAYVRRLRASGPTLAAIDLANGQLSWETKLDGEHWVVSDPALIGSTLYACTIRRTDLGYTLCLGAFDLLTGIVLRERELVELRETWWHVRDCQMLPVDESFIVTCGGAVVRCDLMGNLRWVRKRLWIPPTIDSGWVLQAHRPPTLVGNRLIVVQPCVPGVVALDLDNGRLQWRGNLTTARRILGANESQVFIATSDGVHAIDARSGKQLWDYRADLLDGALFSNSDGLLIATREPVEREKAGCVALAWLETSTGEPKHVASFPTLSHQQPFLGPMFVQKERIWALFGKGVQDPTRDLIEFVPK
jgi:outer membrane protein assembly factor BamB